MKIKMFVLWDFPITVSNKGLNDSVEFEELEIQATKENRLYEFVSSINSKAIKIVEFEVPDNLDKENLVYICQGRAFSVWFDLEIDLFSDYYQNWAFKFLNDKWISI